MRHFLIGCLWLTLCFSACSELLAQNPAKDDKGIGKFDISQTGVGVYRPHKWAIAQVNLRNPSSREINLVASTHFLGDPTLQYGRRLWIPPHSIMSSWHPIKMPEQVAGQTFFELRTLVTSTEGGVETMAKNEMGAMQFDQAFQIAAAKPVTTVVFPLGMQDSLRSLWANARDLLLTARYERAMTANLFTVMEPLLPATEEAWDVVDHLVIGDDRILTDSAGISAIRRWVAGGGSLWVMADLVSPELLEKLMGDEAAITVVDRVTLEDVTLVKATGADSFPPFQRGLDRPATLVRVIAENVEPAFYVNGWPAAFWKPYGEGRILVTTLGADGWLTPRKPEDRPSNAGVNFQTVFTGSEPLNNLAAGFFVPKAVSAIQHQVVEDEVRETIGYSIPGRNFILGTLLAFTAAMGISAAWLSRSGRLEWLGAVTPIAAIISAGVLMITGIKTRSGIPDSTSVIQFVQSVPGTDDVRLTGMAGIYKSGGESQAPLAGQNGGMVTPEMAGLEGVTRRLLWTDNNRWSWENMTQKPGLRTAQTQISMATTQAASAVATIGTNGLSGRITLPQGMQMSDAIIATSSGRIALNLTSDGQWTADENSELLAGQYVKASVLSDAQQLRSQLLSQLLQSQPNKRVPVIPTLYVWTQPWDTGFTYGQESPVNGSSLVSIPLNWSPAEPSTESILPRPLLAYQEITGPDGFRPSGFFDTRTNEWSERSGESTSWIAFDLPGGIMPVTLKNAEITFKVKGSMGRLKISGFKDGKVQEIQNWDNPVGTLTHTIEDSSLIPLDGHGRFVFRVDAGTSNVDAIQGSTASDPASNAPDTAGGTAAQPSSSNPTNYWQFEEISARVTVVAPGPQEAPPATP